MLQVVASYWWLLIIPVVVVLWLHQVRKRGAIGWLVIVLLLLVGGADYLTRPKARPPAWLVGRWKNGSRVLEVDTSGTVTSWSRDGMVQSQSGGRFVRLVNDTLTYRVFFVPTHIRIDSGPVQDSVGQAVWVEGERLRRDSL